MPCLLTARYPDHQLHQNKLRNMEQDHQEVLKLVLLHITDIKQLSRLCCCSQDLQKSVADAVRCNLKTLLTKAVSRHSWLGWAASDPINWLCRTAGAAAVGSSDVVRAVLLDLDEVSIEVARMLAPYGLQLTDQLLLEAAQQQVGGLELLAQAALQQQQQQQQPGRTVLAGVSPLVQVALLGSEAQLADAVVAALQSEDVSADKLTELLLILCNRQQQLQGPFTTLLEAFTQATSAAAADVAGSADSAVSSAVAQQWWQMLRVAAARLHVYYVEQLAEAMPKADVTQADMLSAARLLDDIIKQALRPMQPLSGSHEGYRQTENILSVLPTLPAVQQIPVEIFIGTLCSSTGMAYLTTALLQFPQAQLLTPSQLCKALVAAARSDRPLLVPDLLKLPAAQQFSQHDLKQLVRALVLVRLDTAQTVLKSFQVLLPGMTKLDADSLLALVTEAVQCRHLAAFRTLLSITPAAHQLSSNPKFAHILCTAVRSGLFTYSIYNYLQHSPGVQQWDAAATYKVISCLLQCGHGLGTFWTGGQYTQPGLPAVQQLTAQQVANLLQICVDSGRCDSVEGLLRLPAAAKLQPQLAFHLCMDIIESYPCSRPAAPVYVGLKALLSTAAAQQLPKDAAAALLKAAVEAAWQQSLPLPGTVAALLLQQLPQLQDSSAAGSNQQQQQQQSGSLLQHLQQAATAVGKSMLQRLQGITGGAGYNRQVRPRLLLQLRRAFRPPNGSLSAVKQLCYSPDIGSIAGSGGNMAAHLAEAMYAVPVSAIRMRHMVWQREADLLTIIPAVLPQQHTPVTLAQLLQAASAAGFTRVMLQLIESPGAQQLGAADLEPLLLQSMGWESSEAVHIDDERPQVFLRTLKLPGAQGLSAEAVSGLIAALTAASSVGIVEEVLLLPGAKHLDATAICAAVKACFASRQSQRYSGGSVIKLLQLPGAAALSTEQLQQLLLSAMQYSAHWALELLLQHPAARRGDGVLLAYAAAALEASERCDRRLRDIESMLFGHR